MIHPTAIIDPSAKIGNNVSIGPFSFIGADVDIGDDCIVNSNVVIKGSTIIGKRNHFFQFGSIGEDCQDKKYAGEPTQLVIGDGNVFRESVTIHRGTVQDEGVTSIGDNNLFMAYAHVAHDCVIGNNGIFANNCNLAGHIHVGDYVILGGLSAVHQFCHVGSHSFVAGGTILLRDLPPFVMLGNDAKPHGINSEGLKRRGFESESVRAIKNAYRIVYRKGNTAKEAVVLLKEMAEEIPVVTAMADFIENSPRGIVR